MRVLTHCANAKMPSPDEIDGDIASLRAIVGHAADVIWDAGGVVPHRRTSTPEANGPMEILATATWGSHRATLEHCLTRGTSVRTFDLDGDGAATRLSSIIVRRGDDDVPRPEGDHRAELMRVCANWSSMFDRASHWKPHDRTFPEPAEIAAMRSACSMLEAAWNMTEMDRPSRSVLMQAPSVESGFAAVSYDGMTSGRILVWHEALMAQLEGTMDRCVSINFHETSELTQHDIISMREYTVGLLEFRSEISVMATRDVLGLAGALPDADRPLAALMPYELATSDPDYRERLLNYPQP